MRLGIDFGTTRTVVALADRGNYPVVAFTTEPGDAVESFPSVVAEREGRLCFGPAALAVAGDPGWSLARSFKRLLADREATPETVVEVGRTRLRLGELVARFLRALREELTARSSASERLRAGEPLLVAAATPANAHGAQRLITLDAFREAGFEVAGLLSEPSAAAVEYAHRFRSTLTTRREHLLVYDLGGGTFDASLVRMSARHHEVLASGGIGRLGGDDFDAVLAGLVEESVGPAAGPLSPLARADLLERCRLAKEALTPQARRLAVDLDGLGWGAGTASVPVPRYYEACQPLVDRTLAAAATVLEPLTAGSEDPEAAALRELAGIYVVGGGAALPLVARALRDRYGRLVRRSPYSFAATAIGLAIAADPAAGFALVDRLTRHVGVFREGEGGRLVTFDAVLPAGTPVAADGSPRRAHRRYRAAHNVGHLRFAECPGPAPVTGAPSDVVPLGEARFPLDPLLQQPGIDLALVPVRRLPTGPLVEEEYRVDANGLVEVVITDLDTGYRQAYRLGA